MHKPRKEGGVCERHGGKFTIKTCSHDGCINQVKKGGVSLGTGGQVYAFGMSRGQNMFQDAPTKLSRDASATVMEQGELGKHAAMEVYVLTMEHK